MYQVSEYQNDEIIAAYTSPNFPAHVQVLVRDGNAVLGFPLDGGRAVVVSRPREEGDIYPLPLYGADLSRFFK